MTNNGTAAFIYANNALMAASGAPNVYAYGFAIHDSAGYIYAWLFDNNGAGLTTFTKSSGTWRALHRITFSSYSS